LKVGLQIFAHLYSKNKLFSTSAANLEGKANENASATDLALPGMLPVLNSQCLNKALLASVAFKGKVNDKLQFDRKH
jgi:aspartyl-tRNA(Asn)/glutamyl-tRNA(Gln) amidotransferase subunit B